MKISLKPRKNEDASVLVASVIFSGILAVSVLSMTKLSSSRMLAETGRWNSNQAYYHAENALNWVAQTIADATNGGPNAVFNGKYALSGSGTKDLGVAYLKAMATDSTSGLSNSWITVTNHSSGVSNLYTVTVSAQVGDRVRTIQATIQKNPPSLVFDYEYFLNNWGWWWGSSITGNGDNRANWDFDFRDHPTVNGSVLANGNISSAEIPMDPMSGVTPFAGTAAGEPLTHVHSGAPRITMPNLKDFSYYQQKAIAQGGQISVGGVVVVNGVQTNTVKKGIYLKGTAANPITISGPVVVPGDMVISGPITGVGTLYVGGNLYVAGDLTYANTPDFTTPPWTMTQAQTDNWVLNALASHKDLVTFGVRGSIFGGDVNGSDFQTWCFNPDGWGLKNLGDESHLGEDGIRGTPDDNVSYAHYIGMNAVNNASYDADDSGTIDQAYNLRNDILMNTARANGILGYPVDGSGNPVNYSTVATSSYGRMDGIFYCNHAIACRMAYNGQAKVNGAIICRDEAIVFNSSLKFNYDPRVHSHYSDDPNRVVDLGLPIANLVRFQHVAEIAPVKGFYTGQ